MRALRNRWAVVGAVVSSTTLLWNRIIARWVWATMRFSSLRGSGISAVRSPLTRGRSWPFLEASEPILMVLPVLRCNPSASKNLAEPGFAGPEP